MKQLSQITQTFNDGIVSIYKVTNIAAPGDKAKDGLALVYNNVRYEERTVGMTRFYTALQANAKVELLIRIPRVGELNSTYVVVIGSEQYKIEQIQSVKNIEPKVYDLSLKKAGVTYGIK